MRDTRSSALLSHIGAELHEARATRESMQEHELLRSIALGDTPADGGTASAPSAVAARADEAPPSARVSWQMTLRDSRDDDRAPPTARGREPGRVSGASRSHWMNITQQRERGRSRGPRHSVATSPRRPRPESPSRAYSRPSAGDRIAEASFGPAAAQREHVRAVSRSVSPFDEEELRIVLGTAQPFARSVGTQQPGGPDVAMSAEEEARVAAALREAAAAPPRATTVGHRLAIAAAAAALARRRIRRWSARSRRRSRRSTRVRSSSSSASRRSARERSLFPQNVPSLIELVGLAQVPLAPVGVAQPPAPVPLEPREPPAHDPTSQPGVLQIGGVGLPGPIAVSGLPATEVTHDEPPQPPVQPPAPAPPLQPSQLEPTQPSQPPPSQPQPRRSAFGRADAPASARTPGPTPRVPPPPPAAPSEPGAPPPCYVDFVVTLPDCDMASFDDAKRGRFAAGVAKSLGIDAAKVTAQPCAGSVVVRTRVHVADVQGAADLAKRLADPERAAALVDSRELAGARSRGSR